MIGVSAVESLKASYIKVPKSLKPPFFFEREVGPAALGFDGSYIFMF